MNKVCIFCFNGVRSHDLAEQLGRRLGPEINAHIVQAHFINAPGSADNPSSRLRDCANNGHLMLFAGDQNEHMSVMDAFSTLNIRNPTQVYFANIIHYDDKSLTRLACALKGYVQKGRIDDGTLSVL